uniref:polynucleotide adenylyltransferase n=1 Tax=Globodera rostochiensis TaxID=31243 RepID=A0A914H5V0_GLORO
MPSVQTLEMAWDDLLEEHAKNVIRFNQSINVFSSLLKDSLMLSKGTKSTLLSMIREELTDDQIEELQMRNYIKFLNVQSSLLESNQARVILNTLPFYQMLKHLRDKQISSDKKVELDNKLVELEIKLDAIVTEQCVDILMNIDANSINSAKIFKTQKYNDNEPIKQHPQIVIELINKSQKFREQLKNHSICKARAASIGISMETIPNYKNSFAPDGQSSNILQDECDEEKENEEDAAQYELLAMENQYREIMMHENPISAFIMKDMSIAKWNEFVSKNGIDAFVENLNLMDICDLKELKKPNCHDQRVKDHILSAINGSPTCEQIHMRIISKLLNERATFVQFIFEKASQPLIAPELGNQQIIFYKIFLSSDIKKTMTNTQVAKHLIAQAETFTKFSQMFEENIEPYSQMSTGQVEISAMIKVIEIFVDKLHCVRMICPLLRFAKFLDNIMQMPNIKWHTPYDCFSANFDEIFAVQNVLLANQRFAADVFVWQNSLESERNGNEQFIQQMIDDLYLYSRFFYDSRNTEFVMEISHNFKNFVEESSKFMKKFAERMFKDKNIENAWQQMLYDAHTQGNLNWIEAESNIVCVENQHIIQNEFSIIETKKEESSANNENRNSTSAELKMELIDISQNSNLHSLDEFRNKLFLMTQQVSLDVELYEKYLSKNKQTKYLNPIFPEISQQIHFYTDYNKITKIVNYLNEKRTEGKNVNEFNKRITDALSKIHSIVNKWSKGLAHVVITGSFLLGTHTIGTDIDLICIVPGNLLGLQHFFGPKNAICNHNKCMDNGINNNDQILYCQLCENKSIKKLVKVMYSSVFLIKFLMDDVEFDITFVAIPNKNELSTELNEKIVENYANTLNFENDEQKKMLRTLSSYRSTLYLATLFQDNLFVNSNLTNFLANENEQDFWKNDKNSLNLRYLILTIKLWAKNNYIYSNLYGYLNGITISIMATKVVLLYPNVSFNFLIEKFFLFYTYRPFHLPLQLAKLTAHPKMDPFFATNPNEYRMPVFTPIFPEQNVANFITNVSVRIIREEMSNALVKLNQKEADKMNLEILLSNSVPFVEKYEKFVLVNCTSTNKSDEQQNKTAIIQQNLPTNMFNSRQIYFNQRYLLQSLVNWNTFV